MKLLIKEPRQVDWRRVHHLREMSDAVGVGRVTFKRD